MTFDPNTPFQDLPPLPPAGIETIPVLKAAAAAREALASVNVAMQLMEDPTVLINTIPLLEAQASSEIENIVTTNDELFRAAAFDTQSPASPATREALMYRQALAEGSAALRSRPFTIEVARSVCSTIRGHDTPIRSGTGTYVGNAATKERIYTPPEGREVILGHLAAWERFFHDHGDIDPLVALALLHYQFEAIHPFSDGNGRTGRVVNVLYLVSEGLLDLPITYLSGHIIRHKNDYYDLLNGVTREGLWEPWILFMLDAVRITSKWTLSLIMEIRSQQDTVREALAASEERLPATDLAAMVFRQPYIRSRNVQNELGVSEPTARKYLQSLVRLGILTKEKHGRSQLYINSRFLEVLFATDLPEG